MPEDDVVRDDLRATIEARRELGPDYEKPLVESFLDRIEETIDARVKAEVARRMRDAPRGMSARDRQGMALGSIALGIPLTAVASTTGSGVTGLVFVWGGIIIVNLAHASGRILRR